MTQAILPRLKSVGANLTSSVEEVVYECPKNYTAKVTLVFVTNNANSNKTITIKWYDHTTDTNYNIAPAYPISAYNFLKLSDGYLIMNSEDKLKFTADASSNMSAIVTVEEYFDPANANGAA